MRTCRKCFEYAYVFVGGDVRICPWNGIVIGNLLENTLEEIWRGEKVQEIRRAFMEGNLLGCGEQYCPDCINNSERLEISREEMEACSKNMEDTPIRISLAYDERCNHACPSCRNGYFQPGSDYLQKLAKITENIEPYLANVKHIATNGIGDLFVTREILDMLSRLRPKKADFSLFIETNGVLFKDNWDKLEHLSKYHMTVSVTPNSFDRETYRYLAGKDDLAKFEESMQFISDMKHAGKVDRIRLIMVIQDSNFRQIPEFIRRGIEYDADDIVLRPIFQWFGLQEDERLYKNVLNPCHPYYKEYLEVIRDPLCSDPRVLNWGFNVEQEPVAFPTLAMKRRYDGEQAFEAAVSRCLDTVRGRLKTAVDGAPGGKILIFGPGNVGKIVFRKLSCGEDALPIRGFMVSRPTERTEYYMGHPIRNYNGYAAYRDTDIVLVALAHSNQFGVREALNEAGFRNVVMIDELSDECLI